MNTLFASVYNRFLGKITDDMYMELTPEDTVRDLRNLLIDAIPGFEFPRINLLDYTIVEAENALEEESSFAADLTSEEVNILAILMMISWTQRQVTSIENTRMKYSSSDFKFTSQANHLAKLLTLLKETQRQSHHMQRLYKRRKTDENGRYESNWSILRDSSALN
jgi:arginine deiminase